MPPLGATERNRRFDYHRPDAATQEQLANMRELFKQLATEIDLGVRDCREKSLAFTNLEQAQFWFNAALARPPEDQARPH